MDGESNVHKDNDYQAILFILASFILVSFHKDNE